MSNNSYYNDQWRIPSNENQNKISNYSMDFDGTSAEIDLGTSPSALIGAMNPYSVTAWVYVAQSDLGSGTNYFIMGAQDGIDRWYFRIKDGYARFAYGTLLDNTNLTPITGDQWNHVVFTYDGVDDFTTYINGVNKFTVNNSTIQGVPNFNIFIGALGVNTATGISHFKGKIDQVNIFDYALPATGTNSVATLYGGGTAITNSMSLSPKPIYYAQLGDQSANNGANYLVPNNSLSDYVFNFDGSNDYIDCGNDSSLSISGDLTISTWVYIDGHKQLNGIISKISSTDTNYEILVRSTENITFYTKTSGTLVFTSSTTTIPVNTWTHVAVTVQSGVTDGTKFYFNGVQDATTGTHTIVGNTANLNIGRRTTGSYYINGKLSNVALWNTNLTSTQVETIYNNGSPNDISSLSPTAWYKLNAADTFNSSTSTWTINDYGSGSNDGTSAGMTSANLIQSTLQQTSGFSPYALNFDGTSDRLVISKDLTSLSSITISVWANKNSLNATNDALFGIRRTIGGVPQTNGLQVWRYPSGNLTFVDMDAGNGSSLGFTPIDDVWFHLVITYDVTNIKAYVNGNLSLTKTSTNSLALSGAANNIYIGAGASSSNNWVGDISNFSLFNTAINQAQVTTLYNQGVPSNLNNFTPKPIAWWQLGSNSSFNTNWTCLDEIGSSNAVSVNMTNDDITNGPGYSANGLGTSTIDIVGDAPYSTANGLSENMDVLDRTIDVPS